MSVPFTQFIRPSGTTAAIEIHDLPAEVEQLAQRFIFFGGRYTAELVNAQQVFLTAEFDDANGDTVQLANEISDNNHDVPAAVERLIRRSVLAIKERKATS